MKAVVAAFNQEKALVGGLLHDYEPSDSLRLKHYPALMMLPIFTNAHFARILGGWNKFCPMFVHFAILVQAAWVLLVTVGSVGAVAGQTHSIIGA